MLGYPAKGASFSQLWSPINDFVNGVMVFNGCKFNNGCTILLEPDPRT